MGSRKVLAALAITGLGALTAGCGSSPSGGATAATVGGGGSASGTTGSAAAGNRGITIGLLTFQGDAFFQGVVNGAQAEARKLGVSLRIANTNNDTSTEASDVQGMVSGGAKVILISPVSPTSSLTPIKAAVAAGVKVVCYNTCLDPSATQRYASASIATDQTSLGVQTGKAASAYIKAKLGGSAKIGILNCDILEACKQRKAGFKSQLTGLNVSYVADQQGFVIDKATAVAQNILSAHPNINLMWAANEGGTEGEVAAIEQSGTKAAVMGTDISPLLANELLSPNGILHATTGQQPERMGAEAIQAAVKAAKGQKVVPFNVVTPNAFFSRADDAAVKQFLATHKQS